MRLGKFLGLALAVLCLSPAWGKSNYVLGPWPDHAPLVAGHQRVAEDFIARHLQENHRYHPGKIEAFIRRLEKERASLLEDRYETQLIEATWSPACGS